jgi:hypothetical protein
VSRPDLARNAIANTVARTGTLDAATAEATGRLTTLCGSFSGDEASSLYRDVRQASADSRDPVVNARRNVLAAMNANDSASLRDAARDLFMLRDPLAPFTGELLGMLISKAAGPKASAMWFDGQSFEIEDRMQSSILRLAVDISSCAENVPCDLDTRMVMGCLGNQFCTDKRVDYWKHEYVTQGGMPKEKFAAQRAHLPGSRARKHRFVLLAQRLPLSRRPSCSCLPTSNRDGVKTLRAMQRSVRGQIPKTRFLVLNAAKRCC